MITPPAGPPTLPRPREPRGTVAPYLVLLGLAAAPVLPTALLALWGDHDAPPGHGFAPTFSQADVAGVALVVLGPLMLLTLGLGSGLLALLRSRTRYGTWPVVVQALLPALPQLLVGAVLLLFVGSA
ncbi:MAG: hypothetical protein J2P24_01130 [Streptosporangiales bacterium]|nr:hypothetical protein [Streptosporangiales bacterium]MBO0889755.1 hypothetical protein [Acidothermales bacterium]